MGFGGISPGSLLLVLLIVLVLFGSDQVEHEVLPSHQDRWAISLWAYSDTATVTTTRPLDVHFTPPLPPAVSH